VFLTTSKRSQDRPALTVLTAELLCYGQHPRLRQSGASDQPRPTRLVVEQAGGGQAGARTRSVGERQQHELLGGRDPGQRPHFGHQLEAHDCHLPGQGGRRDCSEADGGAGPRTWTLRPQAIGCGSRRATVGCASTRSGERAMMLSYVVSVSPFSSVPGSQEGGGLSRLWVLSLTRQVRLLRAEGSPCLSRGAAPTLEGR